jgi:hypothetical protein
MAAYRVLNPNREVVATKDVESADDAHAWFVDNKADNSELGWRMEVGTTAIGTSSTTPRAIEAKGVLHAERMGILGYRIWPIPSAARYAGTLRLGVFRGLGRR